MPIMTVSKLSMSFGDRRLFDDVSFIIDKNDKIGLTGRNGTGKTTLINLMSKRLEPSEGSVVKSADIKIGYMDQYIDPKQNGSIYDELLTVSKDLEDMEKELHDLTVLIDENPSNIDDLIQRQSDLRETFEREGGLTYISRTKSALRGFGFSEKEFDMPVSALSGGQRSKLNLLKLILSRCDLMLLDEPTNHLDISSVMWLENFLRDCSSAMVIISHDRYFLDRVTNRTIEIENGKCIAYTGAYSAFIKKKEAEKEAQKSRYDNDIKEIRRIEGIITQQKQWNRERNLRTARSKQKEIDRIKENLEIPDAELENIRIRFDIKKESGFEVLSVKDIKKSFGGKDLFSNVTFDVSKGERVFILGDNGCGKTTLLKILCGKLRADKGFCVYGTNVETGYFDQMGENLNLNNTAIDEVWNAFPFMSQTHIRNALASFLFKGDDVLKKISSMSGGEKARISLVKLMLGGYNFLLLDEPTNHLDASSREVLEETLSSFEGTLLIVSHDRYFINKISQRILTLDKNGVCEYIGNYDDYLERVQKEKEGGTDAGLSEKPVKQLNEYQLRKQRESEERKRKTKLKKTEEEIAELEKEEKTLSEKLESGDVQTDYEKLMEISQKLDDIHNKLDGLYETWESLEE